MFQYQGYPQFDHPLMYGQQFTQGPMIYDWNVVDYPYPNHSFRIDYTPTWVRVPRELGEDVCTYWFKGNKANSEITVLTQRLEDMIKYDSEIHPACDHVVKKLKYYLNKRRYYARKFYKNAGYNGVYDGIPDEYVYRLIDYCEF